MHLLHAAVDHSKMSHCWRHETEAVTSRLSLFDGAATPPHMHREEDDFDSQGYSEKSAIVAEISFFLKSAISSQMECMQLVLDADSDTGTARRTVVFKVKLGSKKQSFITSGFIGCFQTELLVFVPEVCDVAQIIIFEFDTLFRLYLFTCFG